MNQWMNIWSGKNPCWSTDKIDNTDSSIQFNTIYINSFPKKGKHDIGW